MQRDLSLNFQKYMDLLNLFGGEDELFLKFVFGHRSENISFVNIFLIKKV